MTINKEKIKELYADKRYQTYFDVGLFFVLIFSFHLLYILWEGPMEFWPMFENYHDSYSAVTVAPECTSLKQWMHWLFLMLIFPGPWKHKAWYIPLGLVIVEFTNVVRIVGIALFLRPYPDSFALAHDVIFKIIIRKTAFKKIFRMEDFSAPPNGSGRNDARELFS